MMPCSPSVVRRLEIVLHIPAGQCMISVASGKQGVVTRQLAYTIYRFLQYGPGLGGTKTPIGIDELVINVARTWPGNTAMLDSGPYVSEDKVVRHLEYWLTVYIEQGTFYGFLRSVRLSCQASHLEGDKSFSREWVVKEPEQSHDLAQSWKEQGFS